MSKEAKETARITSSSSTSVLQLPAAALRRDRSEGRGLQARVHRQDELLPHSRRRTRAPAGRRTIDRSSALPGRSRTVTEWALRASTAHGNCPLHHRRVTLTRHRAEMQPALPDLPRWQASCQTSSRQPTLRTTRGRRRTSLEAVSTHPLTRAGMPAPLSSGGLDYPRGCANTHPKHTPIWSNANRS